MTRTFVVMMVVLLTRSAVAQPAGSVLTASDIWSEHLIRRPVGIEGREWLALVASPGGSRVERAELRWTSSVLFADSVFKLQVTPDSMPLLLLADVPGVTAGSATTIVELEETLEPGAPLEISLGSAVYRVELRTSDPMRCDATVSISDGRASQALYVPDGHPVSCDEPHFSVQWAGDLDRDGRLDLVTTFSPKYSWFPRHLYLSSAAAPGELVGLVAVLELAAA